MILEQVSGMADTSGNLSRLKMWKVKQKICPKFEMNVPVAKKDNYGNIICNKNELKNLYVNVYQDRLRHRSISANYEQLKDNKEYLFSLRLKLSKTRKTEKWTNDDLMKVMKQLKTKKATDPVGLVSELFKPGVAGLDLVESTLSLCNMMKEECKVPKFVELANITSIFKNKGSKMDLNNDRGIFSVTCLRGIVDKLVYNDIYDVVDGNMSDSNVGGRQNRSIRDNLFIVYGIINNAINKHLNIDMSLYDIEKCFDAQWYQETMNDLWDVGVKDDRFALISEMNAKSNIAIKTPVGMTDRFELTQIEMQGTVMGPIKASVQLDTLGRDCYERQEGVYWYNDCVAVPPLMMIDDLASFSICGPDSVITNAIINSKIECKKLQLGPKKCFNMHIGSNSECQDLRIHNSKMNTSEWETYLGDVISVSGSNQKNIEKKRNGAIGTVSQMVSMIEQISLGHYYFEIGLVMRDSMLISKLVSSSEIWYNVSKDQIRKLEQVDEMFLMKLFHVPNSVPRLSLYIECAKLPVKYVCQSRRLLYYWHILHLDESELLNKFYLAQSLKPGKNDWVLQISKDKKELKINLSDEKVKKMSKYKFKEIVMSKINALAARQFSEIQLKQQKTKQLKISDNMKPAEYLFSQNLNHDEIRTLFRLRSSTIDAKANMSSSFKEKMWCRTCYMFPESQ